MENFKKFVYKLLQTGKMKDKYINLLLNNESNLELYKNALYAENEYEPYYIFGKVTVQKFLLWHFLSNLEDKKIYDIDFVIEKNIKKLGSDFANFFTEKDNKKIQNQLFCFIAITEYLLDENTVVGVGYGIVYNILSNIIKNIHDLSVTYDINNTVILNNNIYSNEYGKIVQVYNDGDDTYYKVLIITGPSKMNTYIEKDIFNLKLSHVDIYYEDTRPKLEIELEKRDKIVDKHDKTEQYRRKLIELLLGLGKRPYEIVWEDLLFTDPELAEEIRKNVDFKENNTQEIIKTPSKYAHIKSGYGNIEPIIVLPKENFNVNAKEFIPQIKNNKTFETGVNNIIDEYFDDFWYEYADEDKENIKEQILDILKNYDRTKNIKIALENFSELLMFWMGNNDYLMEICYSDEKCQEYFDSLTLD